MFTQTAQRFTVVAQFSILLALGAAAGCSSAKSNPVATGGTVATSGGAGPSTGGSPGTGGGAGGFSSTPAGTGGATIPSSGGSVGTGGTASGGAATGGAAGGATGSAGGAATGGKAGGPAGGVVVTGGAIGGIAASTGGSVATGGTAGSSATGSATGGTTTRTGGAGGGTASGGATGGGGTGGTTGSGGGSGVGGSTLIGGPGPASQTGFDWGKAVIDTAIAGKTSFGSTYPEGLMLHGIYKAYKRLSDPKYLAFLTASADKWGVADGTSLDNIMHMAALADTYELTSKASYKGFADSTRRIFDTYPKTTEGAFWHANNGTRDNQLWGDGVFMSLSFLTRYATVFNDPTVYPIAVTNLAVTAKHLKNPATNLFWHVWDESGKATWVKPTSNTNEISWGRAMGWYVMATVMTLEMLPATDPGRAQIETIFKDLVTALAAHQDPATGRWFQVVDMETDTRNWVETSCSSMYSYGIWWAYQHGLVDATFADVAKKGLTGVMQMVTKNATNQTTVAKIVTGLNATGAVADYFSHATASNDNHGTGAFVLMWEGMQ